MTRYPYDKHSSKWFVSGVLIVAVSGKLFIRKEEGRAMSLPCLPDVLEPLFKSLNAFF